MITSIVLILHFLGFVSLGNAITFLYITGIMLIIAELGVVSFGILAFNGLIALFAAYSLQSGQVLLFGIPVDWNIVFGIAFVEFACVAAGIYMYLANKNKKTDTGTEGMIGRKAVVIDWIGKKGRVRIDGEIWQARSKHRLDVSPNDEVTIEDVNNLNLIVRA